MIEIVYIIRDVDDNTIESVWATKEAAEKELSTYRHGGNKCYYEIVECEVNRGDSE